MRTDPKARKRSSALANLKGWWKRIGKRIGDFQARVLLMLFYFLILGPFALAVRWGSDPLAIKARRSPGWHPRGHLEEAPMERATRQF